MPKYWFDRVQAITSDPLGTAEFYQRNFGAQRISVIKIPPGSGLLLTLKLDNSIIIIKFMTPRSQPLGSVSGLEHIALRRDKLEVAVEELEKAGAKIVQRIKASTLDGIKVAFISVDNTLIELQEGEG